jgi:uncharacterized membrane protein YdjX (TVP38/TMEM64 family)
VAFCYAPDRHADHHHRQGSQLTQSPGARAPIGRARGTTLAGTFREAFAHHWRRTLAALLGLAIAVLIVRSATLHAAIKAVLVAVEGTMLDHSGRGMALFVLLSALSAMIAFFSSAVLVPVGVYAWGSATTFVLLWLGWLLGGGFAYLTGRYLGRRALVWLIREDQLRRYERRLAASAPFAVMLLFQLALPSEVPGYVVGVLRSRFRTYLAALALAELPFAAGAVYLGDSFIHGSYRGLIAAGLMLILISVVAVTAWHRVNGANSRR